jgi:hypothetical protein
MSNSAFHQNSDITMDLLLGVTGTVSYDRYAALLVLPER